MKRTALLLITLFSATLSLAEAYRFTARYNDDWMVGRNWEIRSADMLWQPNTESSGPGPNDRVLFCYDKKVATLSADAGSILELHIGKGNNKIGMELILDPGAQLTLIGEENSIGKDSSGTITVNGGQLTSEGLLDVAQYEDGTLLLNSGMVRVKNTFFHNQINEVGFPNTIVQGGLLDVDEMILNYGTLEIYGGTIRIRSVSKDQIQKWIDQQLITVGRKKKALENVDFFLTPWGENGFEITVTAKVQSLG